MSNFWSAFLLIAEAFVFVAYLLVLFHIVGDLFRNGDIGSLGKIIWIIGLIFLPFIALIYLLFHGRGMSQRQRQAMERAKSDTDKYIRQIAGRSPAEQISEAKALHDAGTISADEYARLKAKALA
jgi:hypothetical protein